MIVVDSNVVAYLLLPGRDTSVSELVLRKDPDWAAPVLLVSEMRNILTLYMRQEGMSLGAARKQMGAVGEIFADRLFTMPSDQILELGHQSRLSAYDAEFVILARLLEIPLVTWDKKVLKAAADIAIQPTEFIR